VVKRHLADNALVVADDGVDVLHAQLEAWVSEALQQGTAIKKKLPRAN